MRLRSGVLALAALLLLGGAQAVHGQLQGAFETIAPAPKPHSLKVVQIEEYLNFTCPHCNNFRPGLAQLKSRFGERIRVTSIPILFRGQTDAPLRLFFIAQAAGKAETVKDVIFDAAFKFGVNIYDPAVVSYLARSSGLGSRYEQEAGAEWVTRKVREAQEKAGRAGIQATPTVVLQGALRVVPQGGMQAFVGTLESLIEQLLVKPS